MQRNLIFPGALRLLAPHREETYLDIACGQGAFAEKITRETGAAVTGFDASAKLVAQAVRRRLVRGHFFVADAQRFAHLFGRSSFHGATCLLALQNMEPLPPVLQQVSALLKPNAPFVCVLNHPCFRPPRQSGWEWDEERKIQYRRVDRYLTSYEMPILVHPGSDPTLKTYSYHRPISAYIEALSRNGLHIETMEEWISPSLSDSGPRAKAENLARKEIPLFLAIRARKYCAA